MTPRQSPVQLARAVVVSAVALALLAYASAVPWSYHSGHAARLRLSWSARPERIETCRTLSEAELAARPAHMRQRVECEGHAATYLLRVSVDSQLVNESVVHGAGLRNDRPMYLLRDVDVAPGTRRIRVSFTRREQTDDDAAAFAPAAASDADTGMYAGRAQREATERARRAGAAVPAQLVIDTTLTFADRGVHVITFDPERRSLQVSRGALERSTSPPTVPHDY